MLLFFMAQSARLDRRLILNHAFSVLNEAGLEGLTLRRLAARMGVQAPAIYWHFKNKQELLDEMGTQVLREAFGEAPAAGTAQPWQNWALELCLGLRRTLLRYREGARMFSGTYLTDAALYAAMNESLSRLTAAGFSLRQAVVGLGALYSYTIGFVIEEQAVQPTSGGANPQYSLAGRSARIDAEKLPLAHAAGAVMFANYDTRFVEGLNLIVAGLAASLPLAPAGN
jgi:TetR/AcrR family transcriptional regulator, tetracycline repressor protein